MSQMAEATAYYEEEVTIHLPRINLMCVIGACILALKHPDSTNVSSDTVRTTVRSIVHLVDRYAPDEVIADWDKTLGIP